MATNRYPGWCSECGAKVEAGAGTLTKIGGQWVVTHVGGCPTETRKSNREPGECMECGEYLAAGAGYLVWCPEDSEYLEYHDYDYSGYHVVCRTTEICAAHRAAAKVRRAAAAEEEAALARVSALGRAIIQACTERMVAGLVPSESVSIRDLVDAELVEQYTTDPGCEGYAVYLLGASTTDRAVVRWTHGCDDDRSIVYLAPERMALEIARIADRRVRVSNNATEYYPPTTPTQAREWLKMYDGCVGADVQRAIAAMEIA